VHVSEDDFYAMEEEAALEVCEYVCSIYIYMQFTILHIETYITVDSLSIIVYTKKYKSSVTAKLTAS
jgi:hypothetical protein